MNTKGMKFLSVLAVLAMVFAAFAVITDNAAENDAATNVTIDGIKFDFGTDVNYGSPYGTIAVNDIQTLAVSESDDKTLILTGDLYKLSEGSSYTAYSAMYPSFTGHHGIIFEVTLNDGATIQVAGGSVETVDSSGKAQCIVYLPDSVASTVKGKTTVVIDNDGAGVAYSPVTYTIDFSDCIKAQIGDKKYFDLIGALEVIKNGETVKLLNDVNNGRGVGIFQKGTDSYEIVDYSKSAPSNRNLMALKAGNSFIIDLNGFTYSVSDKPVGSTGTVSQAFHVEKGLTWSIQNGTIKTTATFSQSMLIQNYSNMTLTDVKVDGTLGNSGAGMAYVISNNNGIVKFLGSTSIIAKGTNIAFDACWAPNKGYPAGTQVTVDTTGKIVGTVQYDLWGDNVTTANLTTLTIENGVFEGALDVSTLATAAKTNVKVNGGSFDNVDYLGYIADNKTITLTANGTYSGALEFAKGVTVNIEEAVAIKVSGAVTCDETSPATINLAKGASFTGASLSEKLIIKSAGSDKPVDVETETGGKIDGKDAAEYINGKSEAAVPTVVTVNTDAIKDKPITVEKADVTLVAANDTVALTGVNIEVKSTGASSNSVTFTGFVGGVSGTITTTDGTNKQTVILDAVKGTFTVYKGSVYIDDAEITGGTFTVSNGVEVKINGSITTGVFTINMVSTAKSTDSAIVTVVKAEGKDLEITNGAKFVIDDSRITLKIDGKLYTPSGKTGTLETKGDVIVNGELAVSTVTDVVGYDIAVTANSGSKVSGIINLDNTDSTLIANSGSNINKVDSTSDYAKFVGMDKDGGMWTIVDGETLSLSGYNGTYNFKAFANKITAIELDGTNSVKYTFAATENASTWTMFGKDTGITSITSSTTGSLDITVDLSKLKKEQLFNGKTLTVMVLGNSATNIINGVDLSITVKGENAEWTSSAIENMSIVGIEALHGLKTYNSSLVVDVMGAYSSIGVYALKVSDMVVDIDNAEEFKVTSAGTAIDSANDVNISNSTTVLIGGNAADEEKVAGIQTPTGGSKALNLTTVKAVVIKGGIFVDGFNILNSNATVSGVSVINGEVKESNKSFILFNDVVILKDVVAIKQESVFSVENAVIAKTLTNGGLFTTSGDVIVLDTGKITNNLKMFNTGVIGVYGDFENNGEFTNDGTFEVLKYSYVTNADKAITITDVAPTAAKNARVVSITLTHADGDTLFNADGSADVNAVVGLILTGGDPLNVAFSGIMTPYLDGSYKLVLTNEKKTATVTLVFVKGTSVESKIGGKNYSLAVTGTVIKGVDDVYYLATNSADAAVTGTDGLLTKFEASEATFADGLLSTTTNNEVFAISAGTDAVINGAFVGNLVSNVGTLTTVNGTLDGNLTATYGAATIGAYAVMTGDLIAKSLVTIAADEDSSGTLAGNITTDAGVTSNGTIVGNVTAKGSVVVTDILGDVTVNANGELTVNVKGHMHGTITYNSKYKATKDAKEGEETTYTAKMDVSGETKDGGFTVILAAGADATASTAVVPGYFKINSTMADLATGKIVEISLTEGKLLVDSVVKMKAGYYLNIEAGTTIEVNKSAASLDVTEAALKVSKEATANFETGSATPVNYGKVLYIMSFTIDNEAYKIYSDVAYALSNCDEGSELTVGANAPINTNVSIPAGVNIIVDSVTLTFSGMDVEMDEGAKITLVGTGKLVFNAAKDNKAIVKEDEEWEFYSVTATVVSGDNEIGLYMVRFNADNNTITVKAETASEPAKFDVDFKYNEGAIGLVKGYGIGDLKLANDEYKTTKAATEDTKVAAVFTVSEGAEFELESYSDEMMAAAIVSDDVVITSLPTILAPLGTIKVLNNITVNGSVIGEGSMILADDKTITIAFGEFLNYKAGEEVYYGPVFTTSVADKLENSFDFTGVMALPHKAAAVNPAAAGEKAGVAFAIKADKTNECITFVGTMYCGMIDSTTATSAALFDGVVIADDAVFAAEDVTIKGTTNAANGLLKVVELEKKTGATIAYGATYTEGLYTVYTIFKNIDLDEVSDLTLTQDLNLSAVTDTNKVDISGKDVNITIAEGKKLIVDRILIMGTPITVLGEEGSSIVGKVVINNGSYIVAYADVDLSEAEIYGQNGTTEAVFSKLDVEDMPYAVIFASNQGGAETDIVLAKADASLIPDIVGYNFTAWLNYNGDAKALVGETNAYADAKEVYVTVVVKYVAGVDYYMNGIIFNVYDIPTDVAYGSYFTAKISDTTKYQGNPLINGQKTVCVIDDTELVASGVTPIPEPTPEPVEENTGLSLTDILLIVLVILIAIMVVILVLRLNRS